MAAKRGEVPKYGFAMEPKLVDSLKETTVIDIAAGTGHNLAITETQDLYAWGAGQYGELGLGVENLGNYREAQKVKYEGKVKGIAAGVVHSCAVTRENRLLVWGKNNLC